MPKELVEAKALDAQLKLEIKKIGSDPGVGQPLTVIAWAALTEDEAGALITDYDGHRVPLVELEKLGARIIKAGGIPIGEMHDDDRVGVGQLIGVMPLGADEARQTFGKESPGGLLIKFWVTDEAAKASVRLGKFSEMSIAGRATQTEVAA